MWADIPSSLFCARSLRAVARPLRIRLRGFDVQAARCPSVPGLRQNPRAPLHSLQQNSVTSTDGRFVVGSMVIGIFRLIFCTVHVSRWYRFPGWRQNPRSPLQSTHTTVVPSAATTTNDPAAADGLPNGLAAATVVARDVDDTVEFDEAVDDDDDDEAEDDGIIWKTRDVAPTRNVESCERRGCGRFIFFILARELQME